MSVQPESALRWLDAVDSLACAVRLACLGHWGQRLRLLCMAAAGCVAMGPTALF